MAFDSTDGYAILFGGTSEAFTGSNDPLLNDTWKFLHGAWTPLCLSCTPGVNEPGARLDGAASDDPRDGGAVFFGGLGVAAGNLTTLNDTWEFTGGSWFRITPLASPPARFGAGFALTPPTGPPILYAGCARALPVGGPTCVTMLADSWTYSTGSWTQAVLSGGGPAARAGLGFATSVPDGLVLSFGGLSASGPLNETWKLAGGVWTDLTNSLLWSPSPRQSAALSYDPAAGTNYFVLFGGWNGTFLNETWVYPSPFPPLRVDAPAATPSVTDASIPILFNATITGGAGDYNKTWLGLPLGCSSANTSTLVCHPQSPVTSPTFYTVSIRVRDARGSIVRSASTLVEVNAKPTASIVPLTSNVGTIPWNVTLEALVVGGTAPFVFSWDFADGTMNGSGNPVTHHYTAAGTFIVIVSANDSLGVSAPTAGETVRSALPLTVQLSVTPSSAVQGAQVTFRAHPAGGFPPYSFTWSTLPSFCSPANSPSISCSAATGGSYAVSVRVTDTFGSNATSSATLVVSSQSPTSLVWAGILAGGIVAIVVVVWIFRRRKRIRSKPSPATSSGPPESTGPSQ